eukprot:CAMPEP_0198648438 /NCGR_PEP_ID=MMETSP1467-20131203/3491_1 /TAXON_ID=1462469 /ORGANISM="unid. sp., Strain CCMP2135" /LENGTH=47 /DNA_ID= /DNA_START= /DNA_END= /DNA_ORIENTATION=
MPAARCCNELRVAPEALIGIIERDRVSLDGGKNDIAVALEALVGELK